MLHLIEGPDGAGKSTLCAGLSRSLELCVLVDPFREEDKAARDFGAADRWPLSVDALAAACPVSAILDRGWPSGVVYRRLRGEDAPAPYVRDPASWALSRRRRELLYFVDAPDALLLERLEARGERPDPDLVRAVAAGYRVLRSELLRAGVFFLSVDGSGG